MKARRAVLGAVVPVASRTMAEPARAADTGPPLNVPSGGGVNPTMRALPAVS